MAGIPSRLTSPCSESVSGTARRRYWASIPVRPGSRSDSSRSAADIVRERDSGAGSPPLAQGTTMGLRSCVLARSPRTNAASTGPLTSCAAARTPAKPPLPPETDTSVIVFLSSRSANRRASSSRTAVPDSSAAAPSPAESRCATTRSVRADRPSRLAMTVSRSASPSIVGSVVLKRLTSAKPVASRRAATRSASAVSCALPGRRLGKRSAKSRMVVNARCVSNASVAWVVVLPRGTSSSEKASTSAATSAGRKAARYTRWSNTPPL